MIIILAAPRTGSTLLYQLIANHFEVCYLNNFGGISNTDEVQVPYVSHYGKTEQWYEPSEASSTHKMWFGNTDRWQAEKVHAKDIPDNLVIKNVWNVYRIDEWVRLFPDVQFIWMKRNRDDAVASDLETRKIKPHLNEAFAKLGGYNTSAMSEEEAAYFQYDMINAHIEVELQGRDYLEISYKDLIGDISMSLLYLKSYLNVKYRNRPTPILEK